MTIAKEAGRPRKIMTIFLLDNQVIANMNDIRLITIDKIGNLSAEYDEAIRFTLDEKTFGHY